MVEEGIVAPVVVVGLEVVAPRGMISYMVGVAGTWMGSARIVRMTSGRSPVRRPLVLAAAVFVAGVAALALSFPHQSYPSSFFPCVACVAAPVLRSLPLLLAARLELTSGRVRGCRGAIAYGLSPVLPADRRSVQGECPRICFPGAQSRTVPSPLPLPVGCLAFLEYVLASGTCAVVSPPPSLSFWSASWPLHGRFDR